MNRRDLVLRLLPARTRAAAEAESRQWMFTCETCGRDASVWDIGGVRYRARGTPRIRAICPSCGHRAWRRLTFRGDR